MLCDVENWNSFKLITTFFFSFSQTQHRQACRENGASCDNVAHPSRLWKDLIARQPKDQPRCPINSTTPTAAWWALPSSKTFFLHIMILASLWWMESRRFWQWLTIVVAVEMAITAAASPQSSNISPSSCANVRVASPRHHRHSTTIRLSRRSIIISRRCSTFSPGLSHVCSTLTANSMVKSSRRHDVSVCSAASESQRRRRCRVSSSGNNSIWSNSSRCRCDVIIIISTWCTFASNRCCTSKWPKIRWRAISSTRWMAERSDRSTMSSSISPDRLRPPRRRQLRQMVSREEYVIQRFTFHCQRAVSRAHFNIGPTALIPFDRFAHVRFVRPTRRTMCVHSSGMLICKLSTMLLQQLTQRRRASDENRIPIIHANR